MFQNRFIAALLVALSGGFNFNREDAKHGAWIQGRSRLRLGTTNPRGNHHAHQRRKNPIPGWIRANCKAFSPMKSAS